MSAVPLFQSILIFSFGEKYFFFKKPKERTKTKLHSTKWRTIYLVFSSVITYFFRVLSLHILWSILLFSFFSFIPLLFSFQYWVLSLVCNLWLRDELFKLGFAKLDELSSLGDRSSFPIGGKQIRHENSYIS